MLIDSQLLLDPFKTAITVSRASTNIIDLAVGRDIAMGAELNLLVLSDGLFAAGGGATLDIAFQGAPDNGSGLPGTYVTYSELRGLTIAQLNTVALANGQVWPVALPAAPRNIDALGSTMPRFLRLNYTVTTGPFTAGALGAAVVLDTDQIAMYPSGFSTANI